eukprot:scaffold9360_cov37-Phaeocystis_antarctica.AAC.2
MQAMRRLRVAVHSARMRVAVHPHHSATKITIHSNDTSKLQGCVVSLQRNDHRIRCLSLCVHPVTSHYLLIPSLRRSNNFDRIVPSAYRPNPA